MIKLNLNALQKKEELLIEKTDIKTMSDNKENQDVKQIKTKKITLKKL